MRIFNGESARLSYGDRNSSNVSVTFLAAAQAPAGSTVRATYTVPSGRGARLEMLMVSEYRVAVAAPVGRFTMIGALFVGGVTQMDLALAISSGNVAESGDKQIIGDCGILQIADQVKLITADASTGGTVTFDGTIKVTEYDN